MEKGVQMSSLSVAGVLFPAIPPAMWHSICDTRALAGLMRELHVQPDKKLLKAALKQVLYDKLAFNGPENEPCKISLFFLGLSFVVNMTTLFAFLNQGERIAIFCMNTTIALVLIGLCFSA